MRVTKHFTPVTHFPVLSSRGLPLRARGTIKAWSILSSDRSYRLLRDSERLPLRSLLEGDSRGRRARPCGPVVLKTTNKQRNRRKSP